MIISTLVKYIALFFINIAIPSSPLIYLFFVIKKRNCSQLNWQEFEEAWGKNLDLILFTTTFLLIGCGIGALCSGILAGQPLSDAEIFSFIWSHKKFAMFWLLLFVSFITKTFLKRKADKED